MWRRLTSWAFGQRWAIAQPSHHAYADYLADFGLKRQTYAAAARTMLAAIKDYREPDEEAA